MNSFTLLDWFLLLGCVWFIIDMLTTLYYWMNDK